MHVRLRIKEFNKKWASKGERRKGWKKKLRSFHSSYPRETLNTTLEKETEVTFQTAE